MKNHSTSFVILAAGMGKRMKSSIPKVLHPIAGQPMILYLLDSIFSNRKIFNLDKIVIVTGHGAELVENVIGKYSKEIEFVRQIRQTGTANAVLSTSSSFPKKYDDSNIVVLCGDTPLLDIKGLADFTKTGLNNNLGIIAFRTNNPYGYGRVIEDKDGFAKKIVEENEANMKEKESKICNSGALIGKAKYIFKFVSDIENNNEGKEKYLTDIVSLANEEDKKVYIIESDELKCKGINDRVALSMVEKDIQNKLRNEAMKNGVSLLDPETVYFSNDTIIGKDVVIGPNVYFGKGVVIEDEVTIHPFSHLEGVHIKSKATIGPFARLRPDTVIGEGSKVGNFVEIKKSTIQSGTKINHLSYVGDSDIGINVNIGAGVITCNYDGKKKNKTKIKDDSFIGSNVSLVAPVKVGKNTVIGAGSVITKDVPDGSLSVERSKQVNLKKKNQKNSKNQDKNTE